MEYHHARTSDLKASLVIGQRSVPVISVWPFRLSVQSRIAGFEKPVGVLNPLHWPLTSIFLSLFFPSDSRNSFHQLRVRNSWHVLGILRLIVFNT